MKKSTGRFSHSTWPPLIKYLISPQNWVRATTFHKATCKSVVTKEFNKIWKRFSTICLTALVTVRCILGKINLEYGKYRRKNHLLNKHVRGSMQRTNELNRGIQWNRSPDKNHAIVPTNMKLNLNFQMYLQWCYLHVWSWSFHYWSRELLLKGVIPL